MKKHRKDLLRESERELAELQKWQWRIYQKFDVKIPFLSLMSMEVWEIKKFYRELEKECNY